MRVLTPGTVWIACAILMSASRADAAPVETIDAETISHFLTSVVLERTGKFSEAVEELRKAADLNPESESLQRELLRAYFQMQDFDNALIMARRAVKNDSDNVVLHIWLGRIAFQLDRVDEAVAAFTRAAELDPESTVGYESLAEIQEQTNDLVGAIEMYEKLVTISPDSARLHYHFGRSLYEIGEYDAAVTALERSLKLNSDLTPSQFILGVTYQETGDFEAAIEQFRAYGEKTPDSASARVNIAGLLGRLERYDEAERVLTELIESELEEPSHHIERMYVYLRQGELDDPSVAIAPTSAPILGTLFTALIRKQAGEPYSGILESLDTLEGDLDDECNLYLNDVLFLFDEEEAGSFIAAQLRALLDEGAVSRVIETVLGRTFVTMKRDAEATVVLSRVLDTYGPDKWIHYYLATAYENLGQSPDAIKHLRATLALDPEDADIMNFLGYVYAEQNMELDEAEALLERALAKDPENGFYLDSLGWVYYRKGDADRAVKYIERAIRAMSSDDAILRDHLGDAYLLSGQVEKAVREWRRARRLDPDLEGVIGKLWRYERQVGE